jgi:hypothetical protein
VALVWTAKSECTDVFVAFLKQFFFQWELICYQLKLVIQPDVILQETLLEIDLDQSLEKNGEG